MIEEWLFSLYFFSIAAGTIACYNFIPEVVRSGRYMPILKFSSKNTISWTIESLNNIKICKKFFYYFYGSAILTIFLSKGKSSMFAIHPIRRLIETLIYSRNSKSYMSAIQFIHGIIYYCVLCLFIRNADLFRKNVEIKDNCVFCCSSLKLFVLLNILQCVAHYRVYYLKKNEFSHYYTEILIHFWLLSYSLRIPMLFNLIYVISFVYTTKSKR